MGVQGNGSQPNLISTVFGASAAPTGDAKTAKRAQLWLNIGYVVDEGTENEAFISLPFGIGLDTMSKLEVRSDNEFGKARASQNALLDSMIAAAESLKPGEARLLEGTCQGLRLQVRRVNTENVQPATDDTNRFMSGAPKIDFGS